MRTRAFMARLDESMERQDARFRESMQRQDDVLTEIRDLGSRQDQALARISATMDRQAEAFDRQAEAFDRQSQSLDRQAEALDRQMEAFDRQAQAFDNDRSVMRSFIVDIHAREEALTLRSEAVTGAMVDLAAEIRRWRIEGESGGGASA